MTQLTVKQYFEDIRRIAINSSIVKNAWAAFKIDPSSKSEAIVRVQNPLLDFKDGATLVFSEVIRVVDTKVERIAYRYHFQSRDEAFYFRYDRDKDASVDKEGNYRFDHAECHLHVNSKEPRYVTHATSFEEIFRFIEAYFYRDM